MAYWDPLLDCEARMEVIRAQAVECMARGVSRAAWQPSLLWDLADVAAEYEADGLRFLMALPLSNAAKANIDDLFGDQFAECYMICTESEPTMGSLGAGPTPERPPPEVPERRPEPVGDAAEAERAAAEASFEGPDAQFFRETQRAWEETATDRTGQMRNNAMRAAQRRYANRLAEESWKLSKETQVRFEEMRRRTERDEVRGGRRSEAEDKASLGKRIWDGIKKHPYWTVAFGLLLVSGTLKYLTNEVFSTLFGVRPLPPSPRCSFMSTPYGTIIGAVVGVGTGWLFSRYLAEEF